MAAILQFPVMKKSFRRWRFYRIYSHLVQPNSHLVQSGLKKRVCLPTDSMRRKLILRGLRGKDGKEKL